ncbi:MAG: alpha-hydroxy-acid oxidizing protein [Bryobacterales bacterium]|nr:alpha-hydroxy-acid oxidizing protein [Bryobacterales bacterium]
MPSHYRRREFLKFLAGSPYVAALGGITAYAQQHAPEIAEVITDPKQALDVTFFEEAARRKVMQGHWAYMASGVDDDRTLRANHEAYRHIQLRPRRLRDATKIDMRVSLFGEMYNTPIFTCPTGGEKAFHPEGEVAVARATRARGTMQMLSTATSTAVEEVNAAHGRPVWYQLYATNKWEATEKIVRRVEAAGCPVIALTCDNTTGRNSQTFLRTRPKDLTQCYGCHDGGTAPSAKERKMYDGIDLTGVSTQYQAMTWEFVARLRKATKLKLFLKGLDGREDARLALEHGIDGILVSNHGGRSTDTLRPTIQALPEVVDTVGKRIPVFVDGGVRRGTDVFKALALGATAVGIGRPFLWGMGAFGQAGVDRVLEIVQGELRLAMANCGTRTVADIDRSFVETPDWRTVRYS